MSFTDEQIAQIAYEANRALQQVLGEEQLSPPWDQASQHDKDVNAAGAKVARYGAPANVLHDVWVREKLAAGWTYGETKDAEAKTHPLLVPFDSLSPEDQAKDFLFVGVCSAMNTASDVKTRHENSALTLAEALQRVKDGNANQALGTGAPFGGAQPIMIPAPPERA